MDGWTESESSRRQDFEIAGILQYRLGGLQEPDHRSANMD